MEEEIKAEDEGKEERFQIKAIGIKMLQLIDYVQGKFYDEYGESPSIISVTNIIADRVLKRKLF